MKKISCILALLFMITTTVNAMDYSIKYENEGIKISGNVDDIGDAVNVTVWDSKNNLLYLEEKQCSETTDYEFNAAVEDKNGLKIKVGGSGEYSPLLKYAEEEKSFNTYYVSSQGTEIGDGTKDKPFNSLNAAYEKAENGDLLYILGSIEWNIDTVSEKEVWISGGKLIVNSSIINVPLMLKDISVAANTDLSLKRIFVDKNVIFDNRVNLNCEFAEIKGGHFNTVCGKEVHIYDGADISAISNTDAVIIENTEFGGTVSGCGFTVNNKKGGQAQLSDGNICLTPEDGKYVSVNGGDYKKQETLTESGTYSVNYDYDFKLHEAEIINDADGFKAIVEISAYNRNKDLKKNSPRLIVSVNTEGRLINVLSKEITAGEMTRAELPIGEIPAEEFELKFYLWDSFDGMCPLTEILCQNSRYIKPNEFYVSPTGNDSAEGSLATPFKTIDRAIEEANKSGSDSTILLREGTYRVTNQIDLTGSNITITSYKGENAVISTGYEFFGKNMAKAGSDFTDNLIETDAKDKIYCVNLPEIGINNYGKITDYQYNSKQTVAPILFQDDMRMELAKYPDDGYLKIGNIAEGGDGSNPLKINIDGGISRAKKWGNSDIYADGYISTEWRDSRAKVNVSYKLLSGYIFTAEDNTLTVAPQSGQRVRFINVPEEISEPGEWYLDRATGNLYVYPYDGFKDETQFNFNVYVEDVESLFRINQASNIKLSNLIFKNVGSTAINVENSKNIEISDCEFTNIIGEAVMLKDATYECVVRDNDIYDMSGRCVEMYGGDSENIIRSNNYVTNNVIHDFSQDIKTYSPAIQLSGCGNVVSHNEIYNSPHMAIGINGMEFVIEYNEIYNVCNETADAGAIYGGRYPHLRDNYIRYNYFHDIANKINMGYAVNTVYFDDLWSAADVYSNVFYNVERAALIGGGRDSQFKNNIFIDCGSSIYIDSRGERYVDNMETFRETDIFRNIFYSPFRSERWREAFPEIYDMFEIPGEGRDSESFAKTTLKNEAFLPSGNSIVENVYIKTNKPGFSDTAKQLTVVDKNIEIAESEVNNVFYDYANQYFGVKSDSVIYNYLKNFDDVEFDLIGVQR